MTLAIVVGIVVFFIVLISFIPFIRSMVRALIRTAFLIMVIFLAIAGISMLMNNETIFERPGWKLRAVRFLTENSAATSEKGLADAPCEIDKRVAEASAEEEAHARGRKKKEVVAQAATPQPSATPTAAPEAEEENFYDELMTRNYICEAETPVAIPRAKLLEMVQQTIAELPGWKLIDTDPHGVLDIEHTSRILGHEDDIRIAVTAKSDVVICSQSKGELLGFFPGDFGANIGHIKQFYAALKTKTDPFCAELIEKQEKQKPKGS